MNMTAKDAVRTLGLMLGAGGSNLLLRQAGLESYVGRLVISLVIGLGVGVLAERAYLSARKSRSTPKP